MLRALGAAPHQVRRLIAGEALIVSVVAGVLGILAGRPLADAIVVAARRPRRRPARLRARRLLDPARRRARRRHPDRPGRGLRRRPPRRPHRPGRGAARGRDRAPAPERPADCVAGLLLPRRRRRDGAGLQGHVGGRLRDPRGAAAGGRRRAARPRAARAAGRAARPAAARASARPACSASTSLAANRWRTAALATPIVLVAMLAGTQGDRRSPAASATPSAVTAARVTAPFVDHGPRRRAAAGRYRRADHGRPASTRVARAPRSTRDGPDARRGRAVAGGRPHHRAAPDARPPASSPATRDVKGAVAVSRVFAETGDLQRRRHVHRPARRHDPPDAAASPRSTSAPPGLGDVVARATRPRPRHARSSSRGRARAARHTAAASGPHPRRVPRTASTRGGQRAGLGRLDDHRPGGAVHRASR